MSLPCVELVLVCACESLDFPSPASCVPHLAAGAHPAMGACPGAGAHPFLHLSQANLVAAFEQSLVSMTSRLRHLAETAEEKVGTVGVLSGHWGSLAVQDGARGAGGCWTWVNLPQHCLPQGCCQGGLCAIRTHSTAPGSAPPGHGAAGPARDH